MTTKLMCRVGRHHWGQDPQDKGSPYLVCGDCGKRRRIDAGSYEGVTRGKGDGFGGGAGFGDAG